MRRGGGGTSAALLRASAQLGGKRIPKTQPKTRASATALSMEEDDDDDDDDVDLEAYFSNLSVKKSADQKSQEYKNVNDISISSDDLSFGKPGKGASKFLKKKPAAEDTPAERKVPSTINKFLSNPRPSVSSPQNSQSKFIKSKQMGTNRSSALEKAAAFSSKYSSKNSTRKPLVQSSDSDLNMDISVSDSDVGEDFGRRTGSVPTKNVSPEIGGSSKFLKKAPLPSESMSANRENVKPLPASVDSSKGMQQTKSGNRNLGQDNKQPKTSVLSSNERTKSTLKTKTALEKTALISSDDSDFGKGSTKYVKKSVTIVTPEVSEGSMQQNKFLQQLADTESDVSLDSDIPGSRQRFVKKSSLREPKDVSIARDSGSKFLKKPEYVASMQSLSEDSDRLESGNKFLKKKVEKPGPMTSTPAKSSEKAAGSKYTLKSSLKYSTDVVLDSDEEEMAQFIQGLSPDSSPEPPLHQKRAAPVRSSHQGAAAVSSLHKQEPDTQSSSSEIGKGKSFLKSKESVAVEPSPSSSDSPLEVSVQYGSEESSVSDSVAGPVMNILDLDALEPVLSEVSDVPHKKDKAQERKEDKKKTSPQAKPQKHKTEEKKSSAFFGTLGLSTVDDLLGGKESARSVVSEVSEIQSVTEAIHTQRTIEDYSSDGDHSHQSQVSSHYDVRTETPLRTDASARGAYSEDFEVDTHISETASERTSVIETMTGKTTPESAGRRSRTRTRSADYTEDFASETEKDSVTSQSTSRKDSQYSRSSRGQSSRSSRTTVSRPRSALSKLSRSGRSRSNYSDSFDSESHSEKSEKVKRREKRRKKSPKNRSVEVQTGNTMGLGYEWNPLYMGMAYPGPGIGLQGTDPTPVASHAVSADALEAMTAYSPAILALNDLLKQQIVLSQQFIESQRRMHQAMVSSTLSSDYKYTTLEDTKQYIKKHRKPKLTFKKALKMVKAEMEDR